MNQRSSVPSAAGPGHGTRRFTNLPLFEVFHSQFRIEFARSAREKEVSYKLRYQSYCVESAIFDKSNFADGLEFDELDASSQHAVVIHNDTGIAVGTVRLISPHSDDQTSGASLRSFPALRPLLAGKRFVEISRFCLTKEARRSIDLYYDRNPVDLIARDRESEKEIFHRIYSYAAVALIRSVVEMAIRVEHVEAYALLEIHLIKLLHKFGIKCTIIGASVEYSGTCYPVRFGFAELASVKEERCDVWQILTDRGRLYDELGGINEKKNGQLLAFHSTKH